MIGTIFSAIIALGILFFPSSEEKIIDPVLFGELAIIAGMAFLILLPLAYSMSLGPLQKAEQNISPRILEMFRQDWPIRLLTGWLILFPLICFALSFDLFYFHFFQKKILMACWIFFLGISIDSIIYFSKRIASYLNPFGAVQMFFHKAKEYIQDEKELDLCNAIDGIAEISIKAIQRNSTSLCNDALSKEQIISRQFLEASKSLSHHAKDKQTEELGISDKVSYVMFYLYQRLELIFDKALEKKLEPICSHIVTILGKIALDAAKLDMSLASPPLRFLGKFTQKGQNENIQEVALKGTCTLSETAKMIVNDVDLTYTEIRDPFLTIINSMEELSKETFRKDKTINLQILKEPFYELKELFKQPKVASHQDTAVIVQNIDRVIGEFDALEMVLRTLPTIPQDEIEKEQGPS